MATQSNKLTKASPRKAGRRFGGGPKNSDCPANAPAQIPQRRSVTGSIRGNRMLRHMLRAGSGAVLRLNGATMQRTLKGSYKCTANSQEPTVVKEEMTYASALRGVGIDEVFVARKLKDLVGAQALRWNPKKWSWQKCEDYGTQLAALREIAKIFDIYPKDPDDAHRPMRIDISAIPFRRERVTDGEQSTGRETGDGRERSER